MPNDVYRDDWDEESSEIIDERTTVSRERHAGKDALTTIKDYVIVALIAVVIFMGYNNYIYARTGSSGFNAFGGGGCCGAGGGAAVSTEEMRLIGLQYYAETYGDSDVEAKVEDFGCHQEIYIFKDGVRVARIGYANGEVYEL
jgi:hypothetical protein